MDLPFDLTPARVAELLAEDAIQLVDVRETARARGRPRAGIAARAAGGADRRGALDRPERPVVFVCRVGGRSAMAAWSFARAGYDAHNLDGGMLGWSASGLPLAPEDGRVADH